MDLHDSSVIRRAKDPHTPSRATNPACRFGEFQRAAKRIEMVRIEKRNTIVTPDWEARATR
jgi:hypothetical protein